MTRILEAFSKSRPAQPVRSAPDPPAPPAMAAVPPVPAMAAVLPSPARTIRPAVERPAASGGAASPWIVALGASAELPRDVRREMTGLRISLEAVLTERIPRTVMFLASQGGEGTSTVAAQCAQALASDERLRVLLVDAHVRRPAYWPDGSPTAARPERAARRRQARSDALSPDLMPLSDALREEHSVTPASLRATLDAVASAYDWIVIDGPPVLESPDAATLGAVADGVIVVVQAGRTKRPVLSRAVDLVGRAGGRVLGIVLNRRRLEIPGFIYRRI
jgi:Mrp family chromosome partitioning ATPase